MINWISKGKNFPATQIEFSLENRVLSSFSHPNAIVFVCFWICQLTSSSMEMKFTADSHTFWFINLNIALLLIGFGRELLESRMSVLIIIIESVWNFQKLFLFWYCSLITRCSIFTYILLTQHDWCVWVTCDMKPFVTAITVHMKPIDHIKLLFFFCGNARFMSCVLSCWGGDKGNSCLVITHHFFWRLNLMKSNVMTMLNSSRLSCCCCCQKFYFELKFMHACKRCCCHYFHEIPLLLLTYMFVSLLS